MLKIARDCFRVDRYNYPEAEVMTTAHDIDRNFKIGSKYYSPLIDTIEDDLKDLGVSTTSFCRIISRIKGDLSYGNAYSPEGGFARALIGKRLKGVLFRGKYPYSNMEERVWGKILDKVKPKKVVAILPSRELCVACKKRGVWVTDVQHGNFSDQHDWYGETWRGKEPNEWFPHSFLLWDNASARVLKWVESKGAECNVVGNRWLSRFMLDKPGDTIVKYAKERSTWLTKTNPKNKSILVTLQWGQQGDGLLQEGFISKELEKVIINTSENINWCLRLHPNQLEGFSKEESSRFKSYFKRHLEGHAEWEETSTDPLPLVLSRCDAHFSWFSSTAHEASLIGLKSAMLDPELIPGGTRDLFFSHLIEEGLVYLVDNQEKSIVTWIDEHVLGRSGTYEPTEFDLRYNKLLDFLKS